MYVNSVFAPSLDEVVGNLFAVSLFASISLLFSYIESERQRGKEVSLWNAAWLDGFFWLRFIGWGWGWRWDGGEGRDMR